ncbi:hypothetical protein B0H11DRAFT_2250264 [Mycena galericulata]|nr:hypothetical protein B0H11DRAFT_2250264 [Mycena galericulata]
MTFACKKVAPLAVRPQYSSGEITNPFAELYAAVSGRGQSASSTNVVVCFPAARAMELNVRRDATAEEVKGWFPKLDEGLENTEEEKRATRLSAVGWIMHITEDDGEVDEDPLRGIQDPYHMRSIADYQKSTKSSAIFEPVLGRSTLVQLAAAAFGTATILLALCLPSQPLKSL